jgi:integrase/recombinase XerC
MPHFPKPFFRPSRGLWYVQLGTKQQQLGPDETAAFAKYHEIMAQRTGGGAAAPTRVRDSDGSQAKVVVLIDAFLEWCQKNRAPRTYVWYQERTQKFIHSIDPDLAVADLKAFHVQQWADAHDTWNAGMKRGCMLAVQRALNWAAEFGYIAFSPIAKMKKPPAGVRELVIDGPLFAKILGHVRDESFKDLLTLAWETGARPQELLNLEARHGELKSAKLVFPAREAKGKKYVRIVHLTDNTLNIVQHLVAKHPTGPLLRNEDGAPWTRFAVNCRFERLKEKIGVKVCLYTFRHSFCNRAIKNGVDAITLATLMGHRDTTMVCRVYSHVGQDQSHLKNSLRRATA